MRNAQALRVSSPWLDHLKDEVRQAIKAGGSSRAKYNRLRKLADRVGAAAAPHVACRKGCSSCCNVSVVIFSFEAKMIGEAIGRAPAHLTQGAISGEVENQHFGKPCPFLSRGECSIYEHRPMACRLHTNLADTAFFCSTDIRPEDSCVPSIDLSMFWAALGMEFIGDISADIREFFPGGPAA